MSEKLTRIMLPSVRSWGFMDWGEHPADEIIRRVKKMAQRDLEEAQAILSADPEYFQVDLIRGPHVQHHIRTIQKSASRSEMKHEAPE